MPEQRLRELVEALRAELARTGSVDADARRLLEGVTDEIDELIERSDGEAPSLVERLREATEHFEESHPKLSATVAQMAEALERMGI